MTGFGEPSWTPETAAAAVEKYGSIRAAARATPWTGETALRKWYNRAVELGIAPSRSSGQKSRSDMKAEEPVDPPEPVVQGKIAGRRAAKLPLPTEGTVKRYLFTCAQNNTYVHDNVLVNLEALAAWYGADIHVSRFTYNKGSYGAKAVKPGTEATAEDAQELWYDERLESYFSDDSLEVAPGLVWCGEMNILPTAVRPLSGLEVYTGRKSGIFPHVKIAMEAVPSGKYEGTKHNYTTGTVTVRNYIQKKEGMKAEFHHCYGALLVEVDDTGDWWCRQINADDEDGTLYDLDIKVEGGVLTTGHRVMGIYWGDGHAAEADVSSLMLAFDPSPEQSVKDFLAPSFDFIGDVISFKSRSHHEIKNPHLMFKRRCEGLGDVRKEVSEAGSVLGMMVRSWCKTVAVYGNHERHLGRWLAEQNGLFDATNAVFWSELQVAVLRHIEREHEEPNYFQLALELVEKDKSVLDKVTFLHEDDSFIICPDQGGGIECGMHGDRGPKGSRGTARNLARTGRRSCIGDKHSAQIVDGVYVAGTFSNLAVDWVHGPSDWSCSHVVIYPNGKRAIITFWNNKPWAPRNGWTRTPDA